jgi:hypothetical protein
MAAIARVLLSSVEYLMTGREARAEVDPHASDEERRALRRLRQLGPRYRQWLLRQAEEMIEARLLEPPPLDEPMDEDRDQDSSQDAGA